MSDGITTEYGGNGKGALTATFRLTASDLFWASFGIIHRRPSIWVYYALAPLAMLCLIPVIFSGSMDLDSLANLCVAFAVVAGFLIGVIPLRLWLRCEAVLKMPAVRGTQEYSVDDEGVTVTSAVMRTEMKWGAFVKVVETKGAFLFHVSPMSAYLLPKRALPDAGELNELRHLLRAGLGISAHLQRNESDYPQ